jgi:hypothetical protein
MRLADFVYKPVVDFEIAVAEVAPASEGFAVIAVVAGEPEVVQA